MEPVPNAVAPWSQTQINGMRAYTVALNVTAITLKRGSRMQDVEDTNDLLGWLIALGLFQSIVLVLILIALTE